MANSASTGESVLHAPRCLINDIATLTPLVFRRDNKDIAIYIGIPNNTLYISIYDREIIYYHLQLHF